MKNSTSNGSCPDLQKTKRRRYDPGDYADAGVNRLPPHSSEAEQGVIGCCLLAPNESIAICIETIKPSSFYDLRHQTIFENLVSMYELRQPIDIITLQQWMKDAGELDQVGGIPYLIAMQDSIPSAANLTYYLKIVEEKSTIRKIITTCTDIVSRAYEHQGEADLLVDEAEREILSIRPVLKSGFRSTKDIVQDVLNEIERIHEMKGEISGLGTGFKELDKHTDGLHPGDMIVVAAYPSCGKSSLAMNIAEHVLLNLHKSVGVFSLEMTSVQLVMRCLCSHAKVNLKNLGDGFLEDSDFPRLTASAGKISNAKIFFDDTSDLSIHQLRGRARKMHQEHKIDILIIDYIQLLNARGGERKMENRQQEVADISNGIKNMAKELRIPIIALSQLNDDGQLRESRAIGMDADGIWKLESGKKEGQESDDVEPVSLWIRKNRNGPRDKCVKLKFYKTFTRFESASAVSDEDVPTDDPSRNPHAD